MRPSARGFPRFAIPGFGQTSLNRGLTDSVVLQPLPAPCDWQLVRLGLRHPCVARCRLCLLFRYAGNVTAALTGRFEPTERLVESRVGGTVALERRLLLWVALVSLRLVCWDRRIRIYRRTPDRRSQGGVLRHRYGIRQRLPRRSLVKPVWIGGWRTQ